MATCCFTASLMTMMTRNGEDLRSGNFSIFGQPKTLDNRWSSHLPYSSLTRIPYSSPEYEDSRRTFGHKCLLDCFNPPQGNAFHHRLLSLAERCQKKMWESNRGRYREPTTEAHETHEIRTNTTEKKTETEQYNVDYRIGHDSKYGRTLFHIQTPGRGLSRSSAYLEHFLLRTTARR